MAQTVKNLLFRETQVQSLDQDDPLEKRMATHSSILAWRILWIEEPGGLQSIGLQTVGHSERARMHVTRVLAPCDSWEPWEPLRKCRV